MIIGFLIGIASGALQYHLLAAFINSILHGAFSARNMIPGIIQFFIPLTTLLVIAFIRSDLLIYAGAGMVLSLVGLAVFRFFRCGRRH